MPTPNRTRPPWPIIAAVVIVAALALTPPGQTLVQRFFASLRLPAPAQVLATAVAGSGANPNRQLVEIVAEMISPKVEVPLAEADQSVANADAASRLAGFAVQLPKARTDAPSLSVIGARTMAMAADRAQLRLIFVEAGRGAVSLPASLNGMALTVTTPRAVRAQFGSCPAPANTLQAQVQGPPPLPLDVRTCVVLTESPPVSITSSPGLDVSQLVEIALELSGMSPRQTEAFQRRLDWASTLAVTLPRGARSFDSVTVRGAPGLLFTGGGRRGATFTLLWASGGIVHALSGFGNPADAVPLASSLN